MSAAFTVGRAISSVLSAPCRCVCSLSCQRWCSAKQSEPQDDCHRQLYRTKACVAPAGRQPHNFARFFHVIYYASYFCWIVYARSLCLLALASSSGITLLQCRLTVAAIHRPLSHRCTAPCFVRCITVAGASSCSRCSFSSPSRLASSSPWSKQRFAADDACCLPACLLACDSIVPLHGAAA